MNAAVHLRVEAIAMHRNEGERIQFGFTWDHFRKRSGSGRFPDWVIGPAQPITAEDSDDTLPDKSHPQKPDSGGTFAASDDG